MRSAIMSRYYGNIGFVIQTEVSPSVYMPSIVEKPYKGEILKVTVNYNNETKVNDDISLNNSLSIIADKFAYDNIGYMKYVTWMNNKWKITSFSVDYPNITLYMGGLYNG
jgi:hypothetical protein